jgi:hypothetical protein
MKNNYKTEVNISKLYLISAKERLCMCCGGGGGGDEKLHTLCNRIILNSLLGFVL